jgi:hypothetical protein
LRFCGSLFVNLRFSENNTTGNRPEDQRLALAGESVLAVSIPGRYFVDFGKPIRMAPALMPIPYQREIKAGELAGARQSMLAFSAAIRAARARAGRNALVVAWLGDLHLHAPRCYPSGLASLYATRVDCSAILRVALAEVGALEPPPNLLVFGGDLADSGYRGDVPRDEYDEMKRIFEADLPATLRTLPVLGNHDHADDPPLSAEWHAAWARARRPEWPWPVEREDYYYVTRAGGWRFIILDSRGDLQPLSERQRRWLGEQLAADSETPTVVLAHRPFVTVGNWVDAYRLKDRRSLELLGGFPAVKAVVSGHTHKAAHWSYRGKRHLVFPALAYGIPDPGGWGAIVLGREQIETVFVKNVALETFDSLSCRMHPPAGEFQQLPAAPYDASPLAGGGN